MEFFKSRMVVNLIVCCLSCQLTVGQSTESIVTEAITTEKSVNEANKCGVEAQKTSQKSENSAPGDKATSQKLEPWHSVFLRTPKSEWFPIPRPNILNHQNYKSPYYPKLSPSLLENRSGFVPSRSYPKLFPKQDGGINPRSNSGSVKKNNSVLEALQLEEEELLDQLKKQILRGKVLRRNFTATVLRLHDEGFPSYPSSPAKNEESDEATEKTEAPSVTTPKVATLDTTQLSLLQKGPILTEEAPTTQGNVAQEEEGGGGRKNAETDSKNDLLLRDNIKLARKYDRKSSKEREKQVFKFTELKVAPDNNKEENGSKVHKYSHYLLVGVRSKRNVQSSDDVNDKSETDSADVQNVEDKTDDSFGKVAKDFENISSDILEEVLKRGIKSYLQSNVPNAAKRKDAEKSSRNSDDVNAAGSRQPSIKRHAISYNDFIENIHSQGETQKSQEEVESSGIKRNTEENRLYLKTFFNPLESKRRPIFDEPPQNFELIGSRQNKRSGSTRTIKRIPKRSDIRNGAYISVIDSPNLERERQSEEYKTEDDSSDLEENAVWKKSMRNYARGKGSKSRLNKFANIQEPSDNFPAARGSSVLASRQLNQDTSSSSTNRVQYASASQSKPWTPSATGGTKTRRSGPTARTSGTGNFPTNFGGSLGSTNSENHAGSSVASLDLAQLLLQDVGTNPYDVLTSSKPTFQQQGSLSNADLLSLAANTGATVTAGTGAGQPNLAALLQSNNAGQNLAALDLAAILQSNPATTDLASILQSNPAAILQGGGAVKGTSGIGTLPSSGSQFDLASLLGGSGTTPSVQAPWNPWVQQQGSKKIGLGTSSGQPQIDARTLSLLQNLFSGNSGNGGGTKPSAGGGENPTGGSANITSSAWPAPWSSGTQPGATIAWQSNPWPTAWAMPTPTQMMMMGGMGGGD